MCSLCIFCDIACRLIYLDMIYERLTLVQVMAWRRQATMHISKKMFSSSKYNVEPVFIFKNVKSANLNTNTVCRVFTLIKHIFFLVSIDWDYPFR